MISLTKKWKKINIWLKKDNNEKNSKRMEKFKITPKSQNMKNKKKKKNDDLTACL